MNNNAAESSARSASKRLRVLHPSLRRETPSPVGTSAESRHTTRHLMAQTAGLAQSRRRSMSRMLRQSSDPHSPETVRARLARRRLNLQARSLPGTRPTLDSSFAERNPSVVGQAPAPLIAPTEEVPTFAAGYPPHYTHGHLSVVPWSAELDAVKPPTLVHSEPEDFVDFRLA